MKLRSWYALSLLAVIILVLLALQTPLLSPVRGRAWSITVAAIGRWFAVGPLTVPNNVDEQLARLVAENVRLRAEVADLHRLRELLGAPAYDGFSVVPAEVAAQSIDPWQVSFVINRGARHGVVLGAPAVVAGSTLVGFITELHDDTAILQLLFHPATSLPVEVSAGGNLHRGLLRGRAYTAVEVINIPRDVHLAQEQEVVSVSHEGRVPGGLLVGRIAQFEDEAHEPFQQARLSLPYDAGRLYAVALLVPRL
jgi:cell shape-determining protein MreC